MMILNYPKPNNPCNYSSCYDKNQMRNDFYTELGIIVFWSFIMFYLIILICIYFSNRKFEKKKNKDKNKKIKIYC